MSDITALPNSFNNNNNNNIGDDNTGNFGSLKSTTITTTNSTISRDIPTTTTTTTTKHPQAPVTSGNSSLGGSAHGYIKEDTAADHSGEVAVASIGVLVVLLVVILGAVAMRFRQKRRKEMVMQEMKRRRAPPPPKLPMALTLTKAQQAQLPYPEPPSSVAREFDHWLQTEEGIRQMNRLPPGWQMAESPPLPAPLPASMSDTKLHRSTVMTAKEEMASRKGSMSSSRREEISADGFNVVEEGLLPTFLEGDEEVFESRRRSYLNKTTENLNSAEEDLYGRI